MERHQQQGHHDWKGDPDDCLGGFHRFAVPNDRIQHEVQIGPRVIAALHHHPGDLPGVGDILQRIPFHQHQAGALAFLDGALLLQRTADHQTRIDNALDDCSSLIPVQYGSDEDTRAIGFRDWGPGYIAIDRLNPLSPMTTKTPVKVQSPNFSSSQFNASSMLG